jgi:hypothetical protein
MSGEVPMSARGRGWLVATVLLWLHSQALALTCAPPPLTVDERIAEHDLIFVGTAWRASSGCGRPAGVPRSFRGEVWEFEVSEAFLGVETGATQLIGSNEEWSIIEEGETYLVYSEFVELSGQPWANWGVCSSGGSVEDWAEDLQVLRERF